MATTPPTTTGPVRTDTPTPGQVTRTDSKGALGQDAFLKLMIAQMQHQDPLAPTDSAQMMSQLAQFTSVEQLTKLSTSVAALHLTQDFTGSVALIGRNVTYRKADGTEGSGVVSAVKPGDKGALLTIGDEQVVSGDILKVQ
jgi:flagellar basal-body rod modification protein FlgD